MSRRAEPRREGPVALVILDGWGYAEPGPGNATTTADVPVFSSLVERYPWVLVEAAGEAVGLPAGVMGNSEVGHLTLGSGRIVYQDLTRINRAVEEGSFFHNPVLEPAMEQAAATRSAVHLMGLVSDGHVHSSLDHLRALVENARSLGVERLYVHAFTDGRDTSPTAGKGFVGDVADFLRAEGLGRIATVSGRYFAMDRDKRWERIAKAYDALVHGKGRQAPDAGTAVQNSYDEGITDEFILPTVVGDPGEGRIEDGDTVIFFNFRPDRARQLTRTFIEEDFSEFDRGGPPPDVHFVSMTEYDATFDVPVAFPDEQPEQVLAEVLSEAGLRQLHIAETEKYAHVTFFFNGGREQPYPGELRRLVPSPTEVDYYDEKPEMSAHEVVAELRKILEEEPLDFIVLNFANPDMVGHTGNMDATVQALEEVDTCLGEVLDMLAAKGARVMVTADHGNAEYMVNDDGSINTAHTTNPVRLIFLEEDATLQEGMGLSDVAPTVLALLGLDVPSEMTGRSICG